MSEISNQNDNIFLEIKQVMLEATQLKALIRNLSRDKGINAGKP